MTRRQFCARFLRKFQTKKFSAPLTFSIEELRRELRLNKYSVDTITVAKNKIYSVLALKYRGSAIKPLSSIFTFRIRIKMVEN